MSKILLIEDEEVLCTELQRLLTNSGYIAEAVTDFSRALESMRTPDIDLILLDINLAGVNGEELLREFRKSSDTPVIMLTSRASELDEVLSMSYGADDYITKPYNPTILLLRISAVLKRAAKLPAASTYRGLSVNHAKGSLSDGSRELILTKNEMLIFQLLLDNTGRIVTRDELMTALWDNDEFVNDNALSVNVSRLRAKLADFGCGDCIETRKKRGYILL